MSELGVALLTLIPNCCLDQKEKKSLNKRDFSHTSYCFFSKLHGYSFISCTVCVCAYVMAVGWSCIIQLMSKAGNLKWEWMFAASRETANEIADTGRISRGLLGEWAKA